MKRLLLLPAIILTWVLTQAQEPAPSPAVAPLITMVEDMINVDMRLNLKDIPVKSSEVVIVVPYLVNGSDSLALESVGIYGRRRYIQYERGLNGRVPIPNIIVKASDATPDFHFNTRIPYQDWMDGATLNMKLNTYGCANCSKGETAYVTGIEKWLSPHINVTAKNLIYQRPAVDSEKVRDIEGSAKIDFPVNSIVLLEDFRNNFEELADIRASIDSVRDNRDATIKNITICGYASPEGSYSNNERLALGRTEAVADYVKRIYAFPDGLIKTSSVAEDWGGLRKWVENSNLEHRSEILSIIDDRKMSPDARDQFLRSQYPSEYATLLNTVYPGLRHTDYRISYSIRSYSDPDEILAVMKTHPGNLSLEELFAAAQSLEPDSDDFREVFEVAVRLHPADSTANLNAANTALLRGDTKAARAYLEKAGAGKEANYTRGILALMEKNYDEAALLLSEAQRAGIPQAEEMLREVMALKEYEKSRSVNP
ncbi:MAG: hypothetical protein K2K58_04240 [Muribaculaceae bacterium]|nr:hypothetical protein [Muribaculaceae bacterium]